MAQQNRPGVPDVPAGGVPRHAARERRPRGLKPFLADLTAEVRGQLARGEAAQATPATAVTDAPTTAASEGAPPATTAPAT
ncbi:hypothetical protein HLB15_23195, partial [Promicromonospora citrea]